jgi:hypothetical protein
VDSGLTALAADAGRHRAIGVDCPGVRSLMNITPRPINTPYPMVNAAADEGMAGDLAAGSCGCASLYLARGTGADSVTDAAAIEAHRFGMVDDHGRARHSFTGDHEILLQQKWGWFTG